MENVTINIGGDVNIHINTDEPGKACGYDDFDDIDFGGFEDDADFYYEDAAEFPGLSIKVGGLPENVDREAVQIVIKAACEILDSLSKDEDPFCVGELNEGV